MITVKDAKPLKSQVPPETNDSSNASDEGYGTPGYRAYVLFVLLIVYVLSYFDRVLAGIAAPAIRSELGLTDLQIGLINGAAFSIPFVLCCLMVGWLADRHTRVRLIATAVSIWALSTMAFGAGRNFFHLLVARIGLGVGESGGNTASIPMLIDYFPHRQLGRVMAIFTFAIPIGTAFGIVIGAALVTRLGWRGMFFTLGAISLLTTPLLLLTVREPRRRQGPADVPSLPLLPSLAAVLLNSSFMIIAIGTSMSSIPAFAILFWFPSYFTRNYGIALNTFATIFGALQLVGGILGAWTGGYIADRLERYTQAAYVLVPATGYLLTIPLIAVTLLAPSPAVAFVLLFLATLTEATSRGSIAVAYQRATPASLRGTAQAMLNSFVVCVGMGVGLPLLGALSDELKATRGNGSLGYAMLTLPIFFSVASALFFFEAWRIRSGTARKSTLSGAPPHGAGALADGVDIM